MPSSAKLLAAFAAVYLIWGSTYLAIRFAIETIPPFVMGGTRFALAGAVLYGVVRLRGAASPTRRQWASAAVVGVLLLAGGNGAVIWSELRIPSGLAALLVATVPLWITAIDWSRPGGGRPPAPTLLGIALGLGGTALLVSPAELVGGVYDVDPLGAGVVLLGSVSWATGSVVSRYAPAHESALLMTAMKMLTGGLALMILGTALGEWRVLDLAAISLRSAAAYAYLVVFGSLMGFTAYVWLIRHTTLARASTYAYVNPVVAVFLGWSLASEPLTTRVLLAAAVIVTGVGLITTVSRTPTTR